MHQFLKFVFGTELYMFPSGVQYCTHSNGICIAVCTVLDS